MAVPKTEGVEPSICVAGYDGGESRDMGAVTGDYRMVGLVNGVLPIRGWGRMGEQPGQGNEE